MKKIIWVVIVIVAIVLVIVFSGRKASETGPIKIGFIGPLTGDVVSLGTVSKSAVELAVEEVNASGGIGGRQVEVVYEDGKCSPAPSTSAAQKLINIDKVKGIIGGLCSSETSAFVKIAMDAQTPVISYCSSAPALSSSGSYFFRTYPSDAYQGKYAAEYAYNILGARKVAILYHISDWGTGIKEVFVQRFTELGGTIAITEGTQQDVRDYKTQLSKIKSTNPDYLYMPVYPDGGLVVVQQAMDLGITNKILAADAWGDTKFVKDVNKKADILYVAASSANGKEFNDKILAKTKGEQVPTCAPQAYDAARVLLMALDKSAQLGDTLEHAIRATDFQGVSGPIQFDQNGDITSAKYEVKRIQDGKVVDVK